MTIDPAFLKIFLLGISKPFAAKNVRFECNVDNLKNTYSVMVESKLPYNFIRESRESSYLARTFTFIYFVEGPKMRISTIKKHTPPSIL